MIYWRTHPQRFHSRAETAAGISHVNIYLLVRYCRIDNFLFIGRNILWTHTCTRKPYTQRFTTTHKGHTTGRLGIVTSATSPYEYTHVLRGLWACCRVFTVVLIFTVIFTKNYFFLMKLTINKVSINGTYWWEFTHDAKKVCVVAAVVVVVVVLRSQPTNQQTTQDDNSSHNCCCRVSALAYMYM